eukprot:scaffold100489_cov45-Phaeocystis_antarctica.AAC.2
MRTRSIVVIRKGTSCEAACCWMHCMRKRRAKVLLPEAASPTTSTGLPSASASTSRITISKASRCEVEASR